MSSAPLTTDISGRGYSSTQYIIDGYFCGQCGNKRTGDWTLPCPHCASITSRLNVSICTTCGSTGDCRHSSPSDVPEAPTSNKRQKVSDTRDVPSRRWNRMTPADRKTLTKKGLEIRNCIACRYGYIAKMGVPRVLCAVCIETCASD